MGTESRFEEDGTEALRRKLVWRVDCYRHEVDNPYCEDSGSMFFPTLKAARTFARREVHRNGWHHATCGKGVWERDEYGEWAFEEGDDHPGFEIYDPYVEIPERVGR